MKLRWPPDWNERVAGTNCEMCEAKRTDNDQYGIRIYSTPHVDAVLQRANIQPGYTLVIWRGPSLSGCCETPRRSGLACRA